MKVLQINNVYAFGSTGKLVRDIHDFLLMEGVDSYVAYGRHKVQKNTSKVFKYEIEIFAKFNALITRIFGIEYGHASFATAKLISKIKKVKPDVVHLHCLNGYCINVYKLLKFLKTENIPTVITQHAMFYYTGSCSHTYRCEQWIEGCQVCPRKFFATKCLTRDVSKKAWLKMKDAITGFKNITVTSVSDWLTEMSQLSSFYKTYKLKTVLNGLDTETFYKRTMENDYKTKKDLNLSLKDKIVLHVTPDFYSPIKGGKYVIDLAKRNPNIKFVVVGAKVAPKTALPNMLFLPHTDCQSYLAELYSVADLTLLTSEYETFSMVSAESLACGTPVIGFKAGAPEKICIDYASEFADYGNVDRLNEVLIHWINKKGEISKRLEKDAKLLYRKEKMVAEYLEIYKEMMSQKC